MLHFKCLIITGYLCSGFFMVEANLTMTVNTCDDCSAHRHHHPMGRFKACKLISIRTDILSCIDKVTSLKRQMISTFPGIRDADFLVHEEQPDIMQVDDFLNSTYTVLQELYVGQTFVEDFNTLYSLDLDTSHLLHHIKKLLCNISPVLRHGHFISGARAVRCEITRTVCDINRTSSINAIVNHIRIANHVLKQIVDNINHILVPRQD